MVGIGAVVVGAMASAAALVAGPVGVASAAGVPASATDESKIPHYFGPYPNWANSPFTTSTASVTINGPGAGAEAVADVDPATGGIASIRVTSPGHDYDGSTTVTVTGGAPEATATATVLTAGSVVAFTVGSAGGGYQGFQAAVTGGGGAGATAVASGGVDAVTLTDGGSGYTMPTVEFDLPDDPNGVQARGHVDEGRPVDANGTVLALTVDDPGSGYSTAPAVAIHNGTLYDPISGATLAAASATLKLLDLNVIDGGSGYTSAPAVAITDPNGGSGTGAPATAQRRRRRGHRDHRRQPRCRVPQRRDQEVPGPAPDCLRPRRRLRLPGDRPLGGSATGDANKFIPLAVPETMTYNGVAADQYVIGLVQYRTKFSTDLPATLVRGYVQLDARHASSSQHVPAGERAAGRHQGTGHRRLHSA